MKQATYNSLKSFIWGIANDCLVDVYDVGDYRKIILPMFVIRRFDAVLEPTHEAVVTARKKFESTGKSTDFDPALMTIAKQAFVNKSDFTLKDLKSRTNQQQLKKDFINYLDGFSANVQKIINKFHIRNEIDRLSEQDRLGLLIEKFVDPRYNFSNRDILNEDGSVKIEALDNHTMGTLFEEVIRMFNEETNVTDAGRHFTPRDIVELIADLAFIPVQDKIESTTYRIYDGACGTGGMLTVGEEHIRKLAEAQGKKVSIHLYGQENADETYAIARADMLVKGEGKEADQVKFGSTISDDKFAREEFDFMLSNPPFGTPWKTDLKAWGDIKKDEITDSRFVINYDDNPEYSLIPDIGDPQMLFLANNISKMKRGTDLGSRIVEVHNGSSLFTGKAGQGPSNLRRYIFEQDLCEAIVAIPENMFYNTGIGTCLWVLTNKKEEKRKGKVQLIDATSMKTPLRKNLGDKNCEMTEELRRKVMELYFAFEEADSEYSKVFLNEEFGYYQVDVLRPLRLKGIIDDDKLSAFEADGDKELYDFLIDYAKTGIESVDFNAFVEEIEGAAKEAGLKWQTKRTNALRKYFTEKDEGAEIVTDKKGNVLYDNDLKDSEQIPLLYEGGIDAFFQNEMDDQIEFKSSAKTFIRTYNFLSSILPYGSLEWEKLSIFLTFLVSKLPKPGNDDNIEEILEDVELESYRLVAQETISIELEDEDSEINAVPVRVDVGIPVPEMDTLSNILASFHDVWGNCEWTDEDKIKKQVEDLVKTVAEDEAFKNAMIHSDAQNARDESDRAAKDAIFRDVTSAMELYEAFMDDKRNSNNQSFSKWLLNLVFTVNYHPQTEKVYAMR